MLKETFPEQVSNSEWARYLYYLGRIKGKLFIRVTFNIENYEITIDCLNMSIKLLQIASNIFRIHKLVNCKISRFEKNLLFPPN